MGARGRTGDIRGLRTLLAPDFRLTTDNGREKGPKAVRDMETFALTMRDIYDVADFSSVSRTLTVNPDHSHPLTGYELMVNKLFRKPGMLAIFLTDTMSYTPIKITKLDQAGSASWQWKQTWIRTADGWRLHQVTEL